MKYKTLCVAVLSGLLMGSSAGLSPELPYAAVARAAAQTVIVDGSASTQGNTYSTLKGALDALAKTKADSYVIQIKPGTYREKVIINLPNLTLVGTNADATTIVWDDAEGTPLRPGDVNGTKKTYTMECATVKVTQEATNFQAVNITFLNDFPTEEARVDKRVGGSVQAFAITVEGDKASFYNCKFLARQDTVYANKGRQYYKDCHIEGDVDFICGQASAAVFDNCEIKSLMRAVKDDGKEHSTGYITAPSTLRQDKGYLFYKCRLTGDIEDPHYTLLGRPWHPSSDLKNEVQPAATFRECQIDVKIKAEAWKDWKNKNGVFPASADRLYEYKNTGKWAIKSTNRRQLSDADAVNYTPEKFLGDWKPVKRA